MVDGVYPIPEALHRRDVEVEGGGWTVESGRPVRGDAWTSVLERKMRVPTSNTETARVVRAHEMMHAKISPRVDDMRRIPADFRASSYKTFSLEAMESAEEYRVNVALKVQGFDLDQLVDGTELRAGREAAASTTKNARADAFVFAAALVGTKGFNSFVNGVKETRPEWATGMREMAKRMKRLLSPAKSWSHDFGTNPYEVNGTPYPEGFVANVPHLAAVIDYAANRLPDLEQQPRGPSGRGMLPDYDDDPQGWEKLIHDTTVKLDIDQGGKMGKRYKAAMTGRRLGNPGRLLTDPYRRIFKEARRNEGGIVLIDQSGSMSLSIEQVEALVAAAPGATILGYSDGGEQDGKPNIWLHAKKGRRASYLHDGNGGNGVDGPALAYAISLRKNNDPVIWVTDGAVTGTGDTTGKVLALQCAQMVQEHRVHMIWSVEDAVKLMQGSRQEMKKTKYVGPIERAAREIATQKARR